MFDRDQFVADLRAILGEPSRKAMAEVVARAVSDPASIVRQLGEPDKPGVRALFRSPELTVLLWLGNPKQVALPHDHRMSAVIGMYAGREDHMLWRRVPTPRDFRSSRWVVKRWALETSLFLVATLSILSSIRSTKSARASKSTMAISSQYSAACGTPKLWLRSRTTSVLSPRACPSWAADQVGSLQAPGDRLACVLVMPHVRLGS
jgi:predicted metal-dependent enzyme (double-stranded beta helix superfamily)